METHANAHERPEVSTEEREVGELIKRVRKLRWIGMEEKAARTQSALRQLGPRGALLALPPDTD